MKFGSAAVPVYQCTDGNSTRFILSYHRAGKRMRQSFCSLATAKKEALLVAQRIQSGMQHVTDMTPTTATPTAPRSLPKPACPLVTAIQEYVKAAGQLGTASPAHRRGRVHRKPWHEVVVTGQVPTW